MAANSASVWVATARNEERPSSGFLFASLTTPRMNRYQSQHANRSSDMVILGAEPVDRAEERQNVGTGFRTPLRLH